MLHHQYTNDYESAATFCSAFKERINRSHPKWREIKKRVRSIDETLEALRLAAEEAAAEEAAAKAAEAEGGAEELKRPRQRKRPWR